MKEPSGFDEFLVDVEHGYHYHKKGCPAAQYPPPLSCYVALPYWKIRKLKNRSGRKFEPCPACFSK